MAIKVTAVDVWTAEIEDKPGTLDRILGVLAQAGVNLDCVIARRDPDKAGWTTVYLTPIKGKKAEAAAMAVGLLPAGKVATLRVESPNKPGTGHAITSAIAAAGVNIRGISVVGHKTTSIAYIGFDSRQDATNALAAIKKSGAKKKK